MTGNRVWHPLAGRKHLYQGWLDDASWRVVGVGRVQLAPFFVVGTASVEATFGEAAEEEAEELWEDFIRHKYNEGAKQDEPETQLWWHTTTSPHAKVSRERAGLV